MGLLDSAPDFIFVVAVGAAYQQASITISVRSVRVHQERIIIREKHSLTNRRRSIAANGNCSRN
jgi:hypothetical protein